MKYLMLLFFIFSFLHISAQKKIRFDLVLRGGVNFSKTPPIKAQNTGRFLFDPNTGTITYVNPGPGVNINIYKNLLSAQGAIGARANYQVNDHFSLFGGVTLSVLKVRRENSMPVFFNPSTILNYYISKEEFDFFNLDIPFGISCNIKRWSLDLGLIPSVILNSKFKTIKGENDPELTVLPGGINPSSPQPTPENNRKGYFAISVAPYYQTGKKIWIGIEYIHGLTDIYAANSYSAEIYQSMKNNTLSLKLIYKIN